LLLAKNIHNRDFGGIVEGRIWELSKGIPFFLSIDGTIYY
jgi:hypothetical protein